MEEMDECRNDDFVCYAEDLLARWERRQAVADINDHELAIPHERECLPCLLVDSE